MKLDNLFKQDPYGLTKDAKTQWLFSQLTELTEHHTQNCKPYKRLQDVLSMNANNLEELPFLPVRMFKTVELRSVDEKNVIKTLTSSGTTSQVVSRIFVDKETSMYQTKALVSIIKSFLGDKRLPMIIVDAPNVIKDRASFSARGAGIMGMINFGRNHFYLFNNDMEVNWEGLYEFMETHKGEQIFLFGFTFMIWKYFFKAALEQGKKINLGNSILIHSGGWKTLADEAVDNDTFKKLIREQLGIDRIHNFYGMVEQVGSVYVECEEGHLHAPVFADIIIRDSETLKPLPFSKQGLVQTLSVLPHSYPGHNLLTEDLGTIVGEDDCVCGRKGKYFHVHGRLPAAELRGCSDTHAYDSGGTHANISS